MNGPDNNATNPNCSESDGLESLVNRTIGIEPEPEPESESDKALLEAAQDLLRQICEPEKELEGFPPESEESQGPDLYSLLESLTALRQEIALQGRSFHQLEQTLGRFLEQTDEARSHGEALSTAPVDLLYEQLSLLQDSVEAFSSRHAVEERKAGKKAGFRQAFDLLIEELLDTHDQFRRMDESRREDHAQQKSWFPFWGRKSEGEELKKTVHLTAQKMNQRLASLGVISLAAIGMKFDPQIMKAVEVEESKDYEPNTVREIFHQGYAYEGRVLRFAEVKVIAHRLEDEKERHVSHEP